MIVNELCDLNRTEQFDQAIYKANFLPECSWLIQISLNNDLQRAWPMWN